ncbi:MAG: germination protein YpeB [Bacillota bacterium]
MKNKLIIPILALALIGACGWGYSQYQARRQWEINTENQYQRAFEELTTHVGNMETAMSKALVAGSFTQSVRLLTSIWREANSSQADLGQLPLTSVDLSRTKMLLAKTSAFCFNTAQNKLLKGSPVDSKEWTTLKGFRDQTQLVSKHLNNLRQQFYNNRLRWLQVDRMGTLGAAGMASKLNTNKVTKSFIMLEDGLRRAPDIQFQGNNLDFTPKPTGLTGQNTSSRDATAIASKFLGPQAKGTTIKYERIIKGVFPSYMVLVSDPRRPDRERRLSISVKGGHVVWMLGNRSVTASKLGPDQTKAKALAFLSQAGYSGMEVIAQERFANISTVTCAPNRNGVLRYPELVKVQVAQDNGEILGMDATSYLTFNNPDEAQTPKARYSEAQIRNLLNPHFKPEKIRQAQVLDEMFNKVLCYEVSGTEGANRYLLYYNANTGKEEKIRRVDKNGNEIL